MSHKIKTIIYLLLITASILYCNYVEYRDTIKPYIDTFCK